MAKWCVEVAVHVDSPSEREARQHIFSVLDAGHRAMGQRLGEGGAEVIAAHRLDASLDLPLDQRSLSDDELAANERARDLKRAAAAEAEQREAARGEAGEP